MLIKGLEGGNFSCIKLLQSPRVFLFNKKLQNLSQGSPTHTHARVLI